MQILRIGTAFWFISVRVCVFIKLRMAIFPETKCYASCWQCVIYSVQVHVGGEMIVACVIIMSTSAITPPLSHTHNFSPSPPQFLAELPPPSTSSPPPLPHTPNYLPSKESTANVTISYQSPRQPFSYWPHVAFSHLVNTLNIPAWTAITQLISKILIITLPHLLNTTITIIQRAITNITKPWPQFFSEHNKHQLPSHCHSHYQFSLGN